MRILTLLAIAIVLTFGCSENKEKKGCYISLDFGGKSAKEKGDENTTKEISPIDILIEEDDGY